MPLYLACATMPIYGLVQVQAGIAQSYDWPNLALMPFYIWRQLAITVADGRAPGCSAAPTDAVTAMIAAVVTTWAVTLGAAASCSTAGCDARSPPGRRRYESKTWLATSLPIFVVEASTCCSLTSTFSRSSISARPTRSRSITPARALLALVAFVYFAIAGATTHKFTAYHVAGDNERLRHVLRRDHPLDVLAVARRLRADPRARQAAAVAVRRRTSSDGYTVMFILAVGMLARAAVGPAERLLNMLGERKPCAAVYAAAFAINLALCVVLIPRFGIEGAAVATSTALVGGIDPALSRRQAPAGLPRLHARALRAAAPRRLLPQQPADHLAGRRHRHLVDEGDLARIFVRGEPRPHEGLDVGGERVRRRLARLRAR